MNHDDFEDKLQALTGALQRPDPTPAWKADILARAQREAAVAPEGRKLPPRWLMLGWAACWLLTIVLQAITPAESRPVLGERIAASPATTVKSNPLVEHKDALLTMLARTDSNFTITHP